MNFTVVGSPPATGRDVPEAHFRVISPGYLETIGARLVRGRAFTERDTATSPTVGLVSRALAARFLGGDPIGQRLSIDDANDESREIEIVGVLENTRHVRLEDGVAADIYLPLRQLHPDNVMWLRNNQFWVLKTSGDPLVLRNAFLRELQSVDADVAASNTGTLRAYVDSWLAPQRFNVTLLSCFAGAGVLLAVTGLYGVTAYSVVQRRREIGLRIALGATRADVTRLIVSQALVLTGIGVSLGLAIAFGGAHLIADLLFDTPSRSPVVFCALSVLLGFVVVMASWVPARRASRLEPSVTLRAE